MSDWGAAKKHGGGQLWRAILAWVLIKLDLMFIKLQNLRNVPWIWRLWIWTQHTCRNCGEYKQGEYCDKCWKE